jgi:hypothetical protein
MFDKRYTGHSLSTLTEDSGSVKDGLRRVSISMSLSYTCTRYCRRFLAETTSLLAHSMTFSASSSHNFPTESASPAMVAAAMLPSET